MFGLTNGGMNRERQHEWKEAWLTKCCDQEGCWSPGGTPLAAYFPHPPGPPTSIVHEVDQIPGATCLHKRCAPVWAVQATADRRLCLFSV